uniref:Uncharacterized protein n=1 Tax=viral metagenome TaxID=1070528 RepID=A0A6M3L0T2_9ZZZZ
MAEYKSANVTKYDVGGPANIIDDGMIKSVEQVWVDCYTFTAAIAKDDTIVIARVPPGKRITDVIAVYPVLSTDTVLTGSTLAVGTNDDLDKFIDDVEVGAISNSSATVLISDHILQARMDNVDGFQYLTTGSTFTPIVLSIGRKTITTTSGDIKTIVKYV